MIQGFDQHGKSIRSLHYEYYYNVGIVKRKDSGNTSTLRFRVDFSLFSVNVLNTKFHKHEFSLGDTRSLKNIRLQVSSSVVRRQTALLPKKTYQKTSYPDRASHSSFNDRALATLLKLTGSQYSCNKPTQVFYGRILCVFS